jgi:hypothetical protein
VLNIKLEKEEADVASNFENVASDGSAARSPRSGCHQFPYAVCSHGKKEPVSHSEDGGGCEALERLTSI